MDTGNSLSYWEYYDLCNRQGIFREWEIDLGWKMYKSQIENPTMENYERQLQIVFWNSKIYAEGRFN